MKTWDDWSDFDLSLEVALLVAPNCQASHDADHVYIHKYLDGKCVGFEIFSINNWNDIGQIIENSKITVSHSINEGYAWFVDESKPYFHYEDAITFNVTANNCRRAAAIVFLEMNGVKPNA